MANSKQIWVAYNHMPGGQVVVTHFETIKRTKKLGDNQTEEITFTAETQLEGFLKSDFVSLKVKGQDIVKNKCIQFPVNEDLPIDPAPAVLAYAFKQGIEPLRSAVENAKLADADKKVAALEAENLDMKKKLDSQGAQITEMLEMMRKLTAPSEQVASIKPGMQPSDQTSDASKPA